MAVANQFLAYYRMKLADWQGSAFVLSTPTGDIGTVPRHLEISTQSRRGLRVDRQRFALTAIYMVATYGKTLLIQELESA